ncbi:MAG: GntR family transcriptional regulator [Acetobacteraceae bacterium]|nr:GntR family transcriptional regulator [Acetobacteraceae bacterium]
MPDSNVRSESLVPLYRQVSDKLLDEIAQGRIAAGQALPPEHALCSQFGVSRITVRKALDELVARRIVVRRQGVGTFVEDADHSTWSVTLTGVLEDVLTPHHLTLARKAEVRPEPDVLVFAKLPPGTKLRLFEGTNHVESGMPLVHLRYYFPAWVAETLTAEALSGPTHAIKVVEQRAGCRVDHADQIVLPEIATGHTAKSLMVPEGTAVLRAIRVYFDTQSRLIEILDAAYHPKNYRYTARLYPRPLPSEGRG